MPEPFRKHALLLGAALALLLASPAASVTPQAATFLTPSPRLPTDRDAVVITFTGEAICGGSGQEPRIEGDRIVLPVLAHHNCSPPNPFPFLAEFSVGPLAAGAWRIEGTVDDEVVAHRTLYVEPASTALLLHDGLFEVRVDWKNADGSLAGRGYGVPLSRGSGYVSFFGGANAEVNVKILDGRVVNGNWWVFISSMTDLEFTVTVTHFQSLPILPPPPPQRVYVSPAGANLSFIDTESFSPLF